MLGIEVTEIGATIIYLSFPGYKPLFDKLRDRKKDSRKSGDVDMALRTTGGLRPNGSMVASRRVRVQPQDDFDSSELEDSASTDGILVKEDFKAKEEDAGQPPTQ